MAAYIQTPPIEYDHAFKGPSYIEYMSLEKLQELCGGPVYACSYIGGLNGRCIMYLSKLPGQQKQLERHERAHCNGWRH